jgi:hypothetical protein
MKTVFHFAFAASAATLLTSSAFAGAPIHRLPTPLSASPSTQPSYELKTDGAPQAGKPLVVWLEDRASGKIVSDGKVVMLRAVYRGPKAVPAIQYVREALPQDAAGRFVCAAEHHADGIRLRGEGPAGNSPVVVTLAVHS